MGSERVGGFGCYEVIVSSSGITWYDASNYCIAMGKALVAIESAAENDAIKRYLQEHEGELYFFIYHDTPFIVPFN